MPYKKSKYYRFRQKKPNLFYKSSFRTVPLNHANYRGKKFAEWDFSGTPAKAIVGNLKSSGKRSIQCILIPKIILSKEEYAIVSLGSSGGQAYREYLKKKTQSESSRKRRKRCKKCNKLYFPETSKGKFNDPSGRLCSECYEQHLRNLSKLGSYTRTQGVKKTYRTRCIDCKEMFDAPDTVTVRCPKCSRKKLETHYYMGPPVTNKYKT